MSYYRSSGLNSSGVIARCGAVRLAARWARWWQRGASAVPPADTGPGHAALRWAALDADGLPDAGVGLVTRRDDPRRAFEPPADARRGVLPAWRQTSAPILLVDDHAIVIGGLQSLLAQLLPRAPLAVRHTLAGALEALQDATPFALVVLDLTLPDATGCTALERIRAVAPTLPIVVLTGQDPAEVRVACAAYRVSAVVPKAARSGELEQAIAGALAGDTASSTTPPADATADPKVRLTPREREVLRAIREGLENKEISQRLGMAPGTVRVQVSNVLRKLGVRNRAAAAAAAHRVEPPL